ncbi:MAG: UDP-N-acetylglucosamine 2-epimerase (non-hydrolyzing), partial [Bacteroidia bacterium]|nr:UDP-N-acetylglucosamine 2-epimerase (non-hydrolyzing) [Bacteroidia bacterium]
STLAGALAAVKLHIPVAHVEAGLRSFEMKMPEEVNRILTDRISKVLFCPTQTAIDNLEKEGYKNIGCEIILAGDVMYDAVLFYKQKIKTHSRVIQKENLENKPFVLATIHRAENTNDPKRLKEICEALNEIQKEQQVILPLHPRTKAYVLSQNLKLDARVIDPVGYFDMLALLENCSLVMTDSGGLQKEAYFFNRYCITLRDQTEWVELVQEGVNSIVGANKEKILAAYHAHKNINLTEGKPLYGNGDAAVLIAEFLNRTQK